MGRPINSELRKSWRARISEQAASGLSVAAFCRQQGIAENGFYAWRRRLQDELLQRPEPSNKDKPASRADIPIRANASVSGSGLDLPGTFVRVAWPAKEIATSLEVLLPDQTRLRIPGEHLVAWELTLRTLLNSAGAQSLQAQSHGEVRHV